MSVQQILQVLTIANAAIADSLVTEADRERIGGAVDILAMLEKTLAEQVKGGEENA